MANTNINSGKKVMDTMRNIGWIGSGVMGYSMCKHLIGAGYSTYVYKDKK